MTSSRSRASTSKYAALVVALLVMCGVAEAGRKRLVVLEFEGPKAAAFQSDVVNLLKKTNTVLAASKWEAAADEADAAKVTEKNVKKVAAKLKVDGVVEGKIEKRRDEYLVKLKLRGKDGDVVATVNTKAEASHLDGSAMRDVKDELLPQIETLKENKGAKDDDVADSGDEDSGTKKTKKKKKTEKKDDDADAVPADEDGGSKKSGFGKKNKKKDKDPDADADSDETPKTKAKEKTEKKEKKETKPHDDDADSPLPEAKEKKSKKKSEDKKDEGDDTAKSDGDGDEDGGSKKKASKKKKTAAKTDEDGNVIEEGSGDGDSGDSGDSDDEAAKLSPGNRALDLVAGVSLTARRMSFTYSADLATPPPGYKGVPVGGAYIDATFYPANFSHKRDDMLKNLGITVLVDKVLKISSKTLVNNVVTTLPTSEMHYAFGAVFRYPFNKTAMSPVIGASLRYGGQSFTITPPAGTMVDLPPNVSYSIVDPSVFIKYPASDKLTLNASIGFMAILGSGDITTTANYGSGTATGFEGELSGDYMITKNVFARAAFDFETIGFSFKGTGMMSTGRDTDPAQDVFGARDSYIGGTVTVGYAY